VFLERKRGVTMRFQKLIIISLMIGVFLLTACSPGADNSTQKGAFIGGTQGVLAEFEAFGPEENGLYTIFETESFPIEIRLSNKGEYDLQPNDITVTLEGLSQNEFGGIPALSLSNDGIVDKVSELAPTGGEETVSFSQDVEYTAEVIGFIDRKIFANLDYKYQTTVIVPEVCLKQDLTDTRICDVAEAKSFSVSGAPVTVTSVEEESAGRGIVALRFKIKNVGGGKVTILGQEFSATADQLGFSLDDPTWECKAAGRVNEARLRDGETEVVCRLTEALSDKSLQVKQVKLVVDYTYRDLIQQTLRIRESS